MAVSLQAEFRCSSKLFFLQKIVHMTSSGPGNRRRGPKLGSRAKLADDQILAAWRLPVPQWYRPTPAMDEAT